jgi:hypothetical protein
VTRESNTEYGIKQRKSDDVTSLHSFSLIYHAPCHADERYVQLVGIDHFDAEATSCQRPSPTRGLARCVASPCQMNFAELGSPGRPTCGFSTLSRCRVSGGHLLGWGSSLPRSDESETCLPEVRSV